MANLLKIKTIAEEKNIPLKDIADYVGITPTGLSKIFRENSTKTTTLEKIALKLKVPVSVFFDDAITLEENDVLDPDDTIPKGAVPFWDLPVSAGHSVVDIIGTKDPVGYIKNLPGIEITEHILPITGMSMEPEVCNGAIIGVRKIDNWETLNTERIYLIITHDDRMIKRIEHDEEDSSILWCLSPNYPKFKIYKVDIIEVQRVCFVYNPK